MKLGLLSKAKILLNKIVGLLKVIYININNVFDKRVDQTSE